MVVLGFEIWARRQPTRHQIHAAHQSFPGP